MPLLVAIAVVLSPVIVTAFAVRLFRHLSLVVQLRSSWPRGKFVLIAYTQTALRAPYIEDTVLPRIAKHCIVVNRSREDWKRQYRLEQTAISFWGGRKSYNPLAIVLRRGGRVKVFRFYERFRI